MSLVADVIVLVLLHLMTFGNVTAKLGTSESLVSDTESENTSRVIQEVFLWSKIASRQWCLIKHQIIITSSFYTPV